MEPWQEEMRNMARLEKQLEEKPVCDICGDHIQDDYYYDMGTANVCPDCLKDWAEEYRRTL